MRDIAGHCSALLVLALSLGCGDDQQGPSADGPPFFSATIDGVPWFPDDFSALLASDSLRPEVAVHLQARRSTEAGGGEAFFFNLWLPDAFRLGSYRLEAGSATESAAAFQQVPSPLDSELFFSTSESHRGTLRITGSNPTDSVVSGVFAFEAENILTNEVRRFRGEFRVRYITEGS
jgi:hypothetical protein